MFVWYCQHMTTKLLTSGDLDEILSLGEALSPTVQTIRQLQATIDQYDAQIENTTMLRDQAKDQLADAKRYLKTFIHIEEKDDPPAKKAAAPRKKAAAKKA